ncbi:Mss4-like protein [Peziza echinospora]|nr:Mss4-like protein [Peziza echinospora]
MASPATTPLTSTCTCGSITLTLPDPPTSYAPSLCFCSHCAKSSSTGQAGILVPTATLTIADAQNTLKSYSYDVKELPSGKQKVKYFCGRCGDPTHLWVEAIEGMMFVYAGGTLGEQRKFLKPVEYVLFGKNKPDYLEFAKGVTVFEEMPPEH